MPDPSAPDFQLDLNPEQLAAVAGWFRGRSEIAD